MVVDSKAETRAAANLALHLVELVNDFMLVVDRIEKGMFSNLIDGISCHFLRSDGIVSQEKRNSEPQKPANSIVKRGHCEEPPPIDGF